MLILLPPSETKRPGGRTRRIAVEALSFPQLAAERHAVIDALVALAADEDAAARVLKLSVSQLPDIALNAAL
ncbi:MAG: peroxide stress protein YaaA, partial [Microbacterium sp.]|nr:peroxide stress protein YaaA [Microbacterium sp.]